MSSFEIIWAIILVAFLISLIAYTLFTQRRDVRNKEKGKTERRRKRKEFVDSITLKRPLGLTKVEEPQFLKLQDAFRRLCVSRHEVGIHEVDSIKAQRSLEWCLEHYQEGPLATPCREVIERTYDLLMKRDYRFAEHWAIKWNLS